MGNANESSTQAIINDRAHKEFIADNKFSKQVKFDPITDIHPLMARAITFDERNLLLAKTRRNAEGPSLKRSATFVSKTKVDVSITSSLEDVKYRKYFGKVDSRNRTSDTTYRASFDVTEENHDDVNEVVIIIDPLATGALLACEAIRRGFKIVAVLTIHIELFKSSLPPNVQDSFVANIIFNNSIDAEVALDLLANEIMSLALPVSAVIAGAETGVELADQLSTKFGVRSNGTALSLARRNKYVMGETIRSAGIRAVKQKAVSTWEEVQGFLSEWTPEPFRVIVKPTDSVGSEDVTLCMSVSEVRSAFGHIIGKVNSLGLVNKTVLVQEYLDGIEYVVDMVSVDGNHKVAALWEYDRRAVNGAGFVLYGMKVLFSEDPRCQQLIDYQKSVCTALGIMNGPSTAKIIFCNNAPCLLDVSACCHGGEGVWTDVANECYANNQIALSLDAYLNVASFNAQRDEPKFRGKHGAIKFLVCHNEGILNSLDDAGLKEIHDMGSYRSHQMFISPEKQVCKTVNCLTWGGCVKLIHSDLQPLCSDYVRLEELESTTLFQVVPSPSSVSRAVGIVDPFSTGASLAAYCWKSGYKIIAIYSANLQQLSGMTNLIPPGLELEFTCIVGYEDDIDAMIHQIKGPNVYDIKAIIAGAETGVELADQLSTKIGLRSNGTALSLARRNKYVMGETIRSAGIRAVKQKAVSTWEEVQGFLSEWTPEPFRVIVKPTDSAGSEDVTLCTSVSEVRSAFGHIIGKVNSLGLVNKTVLVQEYLDGIEYVVDMVSVDGNHKVAALWEYDRRAVNGAGFVMFGTKPLLATDPRCQQLIDYQKSVCTALGIMNGPSHGEVKWSGGSPCLVEVGARCHGGEGVWVGVSDAVFGYNQVEMTSAAFLNIEAFLAYPSQPTLRCGHGRLLCLVSKVSGILLEINSEYIEEMRNMKSFKHCDIFVKPGQPIVATTNCFNLAGNVVLTDHDEECVLKDYNRIREMEDSNLFIVCRS